MENSESRVAEILLRCGTPQKVMPSTALYEEGWMLRLVLDWFSRHSPKNHPLSFDDGSKWYSEALLHTQFRAQTRGDKLAESWTHADGAIGHFAIGGTGAGDLVLEGSASQLVIIEAKMFSGLSAGTKNASSFNQVARNIACMAEALHKADRKPTQVPNLRFVICAPQEKIDMGIFNSQIEKEHIRQSVAARVQSYGASKDKWFSEWFEPTLDAIKISLLSWETILCDINAIDTFEGTQLKAFYEQCLEFNRRKI